MVECLVDARQGCGFLAEYQAEEAVARAHHPCRHRFVGAGQY
jgi:hypothetical protein